LGFYFLQGTASDDLTQTNVKTLRVPGWISPCAAVSNNIGFDFHRSRRYAIYPEKFLNTHFLNIASWMWWVVFLVMISRDESDVRARFNIEPDLNPNRCNDSA
jgi:hypothetical protein